MMFYCEACAVKNKWPMPEFSRSFGPCELCEDKGPNDCFDVPSQFLPEREKQRGN